MGQGPLRDPRLAEIESKLNAGSFEEAQRLLATTFDAPDAGVASAYFATRILFQRGRLDRTGVIERLRELLARVSEFPEAERMLRAAEAGILEPSPDIFRRVTGAPQSPTPLKSPERIGTKALSRQDIPRAPLVPRFTPRSGTPSYVPATPMPPTPAPLQQVQAATEERRTEPGLGPTAAEAAPEVSARKGAATLSAPTPVEARIPSLEVPKQPSVRPSAQPPHSSPPPPARDFETQAPAKAVRNSVIAAPADEEASREQAAHSPSLFEIAAALDAGHPAHALELTERAAPELGAELILLSARALVALGKKERAGAQLERLLRAPLIEPLVRAGSARLLIEIDRPEEALVQARRARLDDPEDLVSRVTLAWALVRVMRRGGDTALAGEAEPLLTATRLREGAISGLMLALRAALAAESGDPARAISLAQTALQQDPRQADALAAIAIASARLGLRSDAERAQQRLAELNPEEAKWNARSLLKHGLRLEKAREPSPANLQQAAKLWGKEEAALLAGQKDLAIRALIAASAERVQSLSRRGGSDAWPRMAVAAARAFTELPVLRHFAPFDCSTFSVERLDAALNLIFPEKVANADESLDLIIGAYVGECYRQAFGGEWQGVPTFPLSATIEGVGISTRPCERARDRLKQGVPLTLEAPERLHPGADPLGNSVPLSLAPAAPWDPESWPSASMFVELGRLLPHSVVGLHCERALESPLDHSVAGAVAVDRYVALLAPAKAPPDPNGAWTRRVALLLGAYLGEVLVDAVGARWEMNDRPDGPDGYRLLLPHGTLATPVKRVLDRLAGRRVSPLSEYTARLAAGRVSMPA